MSKVLRRKMFNTPKYEHQSTGIASGLEYRPGYRVGGRVGYKDGTDPWVTGQDPRTRKQKEFTNFIPSNRQDPLDASPAMPTVTDEMIANINPDLTTEPKQDFLTTPKDALTESQRIAKLLAGEIPGTDFSKHAIDYEKYAIDYDKYGPSRLGAVGTAAGRVIKDPIPAEVSQVGSFFGNLAETSADYRAKKDELSLQAEQDAKQMAMLTDQQAQDLAFKREDQIRADKRAETDLTVELYKGALSDELARDEMNMNISIANQEFENRIATANIGAEAQRAVQMLANAKMPEKLMTFMQLQKPKSEGGIGASAEDAFATAFGQRDDQIQFASTLLQAFSASIMPGDLASSGIAIQKTIQTMNLLFPGVFNLTEEDLAGLMQNITINQDGSNYKGINQNTGIN